MHMITWVGEMYNHLHKFPPLCQCWIYIFTNNSHMKNAYSSFNIKAMLLAFTIFIIYLKVSRIAPTLWLKFSSKYQLQLHLWSSGQNPVSIKLCCRARRCHHPAAVIFNLNQYNWKTSYHTHTFRFPDSLVLPFAFAEPLGSSGWWWWDFNIQKILLDSFKLNIIGTR